ncbi:T9SS type A sorting domain-containing protein [Cryomorpha ignava]|uniref:T9SS type A sorting domain-containing protein n=1 Tax=Cryomorpha ignava TaxID=101383 RepID=A0A7K3WNL3_9FLAO|nr:T9SS type A sorting domain-containing protein [Cryomorpha ignava]NEN23118.1 T9SS type A sorting domain-containing protein [Cryomorpha ignava]
MKLKNLPLPLLLLLLFLSATVKSQYLVNSEFLNFTNSFSLGFVPGIPAQYDVDFYRITYNTTNTAGEPTIASGAVAIPVSAASCNSFPMIAYCHGTVLKQLDVPSYNNLEGFLTKVFASTGFIAVAPDYLGLGQNPGIHPYVHAESEATATIDLIRAAREFLETKPQQDNGELFITGYSQGGQAAMATLKYAEENDLNEELGIVAGAPCSGPYDLSGSQAEVILSDAPYSNPGYIVYLLISYQLAYGNLYTDLSDIIQSPYDTIVTPFFDGVQNTYSMNVVNDTLPNQLSNLLVDSVYSNFQSNPNHPLWLDLEDNDTHNWTPQVPLRMFYCTGDEQVNYQNSITADSAMNANGAADVQALNSLAGATHGQCIQPALVDVYEFFSGLATACDLVSGIAENKQLKLDVYPNPASDWLNVIIPEKGGYLIVQDTYGRVVMERNIAEGQTQVDISKLAAATYVVSFQAGKIIRRSTLVVQ